MKQEVTVKLTLTPEQQAQLREATGKPLASLKLQPLETRLLPGARFN